MGAKTHILSSIEQTYLNKTDKFEISGQSLQSERDLAGIGNQYTYIHPLPISRIDKKRIVKRIDICYVWNIEVGGTKLRWSQGEVTDISNSSHYVLKGEAVMLRWDESKDKNEPSCISSQCLLPSK